MAKNRKNQSAAIRFGPAIKAFLLCAMIGGAGVGYVWQKSQIGELDRQITRREKRLAELQQLNEKLRRQLDSLRSPQSLEKSVKELNLGLVPTQSSQFWRLSEPMRGPVTAGAERQYAQETGTQAMR
jgi:DNA repair exonuclease SbcCD ATPase subunit